MTYQTGKHNKSEHLFPKTALRSACYLIRTQTLGKEKGSSLESELFRQSGTHFSKSSARPQTTWAVLRYHLGHGMCSQKKIRAVKRNLKYHICTKNLRVNFKSIIIWWRISCRHRQMVMQCYQGDYRTSLTMRHTTWAGTITGYVDRFLWHVTECHQKGIDITGCGNFTGCGVEKLEITEIRYWQTSFVVSFVLD